MLKKFFQFNNRAFSLIETMVALTILATVFIGLMQAFPFGLSINKAAENATKASYLAQAKIEELYSLNYSGINVGTIEAKHRLADDPTSYLYSFQRETVVNFIDGDLNNSVSDNGMKKITSTVYYIDAVSKKERDYRLDTIISQK